MEPERRSRRDPRQDKELDYVHQRRSGAEYPHAWRSAWPAKKARSRRAFRRGQAAALRMAQGRVDPVRVDQAVSRADRVHRREVRSWLGPTLRDAVASGLQARVERAGWNFFKCPYDSGRHRRAFVAFLTALTAARYGRCAALAARFDRILRTPVPAPATVTWKVSCWPPDVRRQRAWLADFFADEPAWEPRLRTWTAATRSIAVP